MKSTKTNWIFLKATDLVRFAKHSLSKSERDGQVASLLFFCFVFKKSKYKYKIQIFIILF